MHFLAWAFATSTLRQQIGVAMPLMASLRTRSRKDGTVYYAVLYRDIGKQTSTSFEDLGTATSFQKLVDVVGPVKGPGVSRRRPSPVDDHGQEVVGALHRALTGLAKSTLADYESYAKNDINPALGAMPLTALSTDDIAKWTQAMADAGQSARRS